MGEVRAGTQQLALTQAPGEVPRGTTDLTVLRDHDWHPLGGIRVFFLGFLTPSDYDMHYSGCQPLIMGLVHAVVLSSSFSVDRT